MEIDLDNPVFSGPDEAEERNAERLEEADKKPGDRCRRRLRRRLQNLIVKPASRPVFDAHTFRWVKPFQRIQQRLRRLRQRQMSGMDRADALLNRRIAERDADGAQRCHLRFTQRRHRAAPVPLATILPTVTS